MRDLIDFYLADTFFKRRDNSPWHTTDYDQKVAEVISELTTKFTVTE